MGTEAPVIVGEVPAVSLEAIAQKMQAISALSPEARKDAIEAILKDPKKRASVLAFQAARRQSEQTARDAQAQQGWAGWAANGVVSAVSSAASVVGLTRPAPTTANGSFAADSLTDDLTLTLSMVSTNDDLPAITSPTPNFLEASQVLSFVDPSSLELRLAEAHAVEATENTPIPPIDSPPQPSEALTATMDDSVIVDSAEANSDFDSGDESLGEDDGPPAQKRDADQADEAAEALRAQEAQQRAAEIEAEATSREEQTRKEAEEAAALQRAEEATRVEKARRDAEEAAKQKALLEKQEALKKQQEEADAQRKAKQTAQNAAHAHKEKPEAGATTSKVDSVRTFFAFPPSVTTAAPQQPKVKQPPAAAPKVTPLVSQQPKSAQQAAQQSVFLAQKQKQEDDQKAAALALKLKQEEQEQKQAAALEAAAERRRFENDLRHRANVMGL